MGPLSGPKGDQKGGPFWPKRGPKWDPLLGQKGDQKGTPFWSKKGSPFGPLLVQKGVPFWSPFGPKGDPILVPFWIHFGSTLGPLWDPLWIHFGATLGSQAALPGKVECSYLGCQAVRSTDPGVGPIYQGYPLHFAISLRNHSLRTRFSYRFSSIRRNSTFPGRAAHLGFCILPLGLDSAFELVGLSAVCDLSMYFLSALDLVVVRVNLCFKSNSLINVDD